MGAAPINTVENQLGAPGLHTLEVCALINVQKTPVLVVSVFKDFVTGAPLLVHGPLEQGVSSDFPLRTGYDVAKVSQTHVSVDLPLVLGPEVPLEVLVAFELLSALGTDQLGALGLFVQEGVNVVLLCDLIEVAEGTRLCEGDLKPTECLQEIPLDFFLDNVGVRY